jgi:hypothetical protein
MVVYESHKDNEIYVNDEVGEHVFNSEKEYEEYKNKRFDNLPIICDNCIYHLQKNKKKFSCPLDKNRKNENSIEQCEGHCKGCSYYYKNPETLKDWFKWFKTKFMNYYFYYKRKIEYNFHIGYYCSFRKFFFYWPSFKYPYFEFVHRTRNEYENECYICHIGWISKEHSHFNKASLFEKFYWTEYHFLNEHINYEYALCINDFYVDTFNNIKSGDSHFKCHKGEIYKVRPIRKYKYYDILYNVKSEDEYELRLKGQITKDEFDKHFRIPNDEELITLFQERNTKKREQEKENKIIN